MSLSHHALPSALSPPRHDWTRAEVEALFAKHNGRITTGELNRALGDLKDARPGPQGERGRRLKLMYGTQVSTRPPRFRIGTRAATW